MIVVHYQTTMAVLLAVAIGVAGLAVDLATPLAQAGGVGYVALVIPALWLPWRRASLALGALGTVLIAIGYPGAANAAGPWVAGGGRGLALGALWLAAASMGRCRAATILGDRAAHLRALIDTTADGVILIDTAGTVQEFNAACERLFGYTATEVTGRNVNMLMPPPYHDEHDDYLRHYRETGERRIIGTGRVVEGRRKDGSVFPMQLWVGETTEGKEPVFVGTIRDLTEKELAAHALNQAKEQAEAANRAKSLFLANMTHELRTPMNAVLGYAQIMRNDATISESHRAAVQAIMHAGNHLMELINDILDLSKIEAGAMEVRTTDFSLWDLAEGLADIFRVRCEEKGIGWRVENEVHEHALVRGDHGKLRQVLINFLGNAVKFTDEGEVVLRLSRDGERYRFEVADTGPGIAADAQEQIFEPFHQAEVGRAKGGTGLGLAIARRQIELMGGELGLEARPGEGSRFFFTLSLPVVEEGGAQHTQEAERIVGLAPECGVDALVVDDVKDNRDILQHMLTTIGATVRTAGDGREALEQVRERHPDIVFMDIRMPVLDGVDALAELRRSQETRDIVCIAVTASGMLHQSEHFLAAGFDAIVSKPFHFESIYECLRTHLGTRFLHQEVDPAAGYPRQEPIDLAAIVLTDEVYERLIKAARVNDFTEIDAILDEVAVGDNGSRDLAHHLRGLLRRYDSAGILATLEKVRHG
ncbi:MAG: PAS domain S-box protein [Nitrospirota bacterium]|jgi:PAS domain S-box-containing protein